MFDPVTYLFGTVPMFAGPNDPPYPEVNEPEDLPESDPVTPPEGLPPDVQPDIPPVERPEI